MAIAASAVIPSNSLEEFRIEFNNLVSDVDGISAKNTFDASIIFEGATADAYETTLTVVDPTADRTITIPNETGTLITTNTTASTTVVGIVELATDAETITGTDTARAVTPANIQAKVASATAKGIAELATTAETVTGTDTARVITPAGLHGALAGLTDTTIVAGDSIIFADANDSNALKEDTVQGILDLGNCA